MTGSQLCLVAICCSSKSASTLCLSFRRMYGRSLRTLLYTYLLKTVPCSIVYSRLENRNSGPSSTHTNNWCTFVSFSALSAPDSPPPPLVLHSLALSLTL
ncbi:hypothetical protein CW304_00470 [Bacillus sp. UFRGS-B20]|nr:hypothetical protein CW304_00470 [Bacillus sp. UFRGS-B20]